MQGSGSLMEIEEALFSRLSTFTGLSALVGSRIYPMLMPQNCVNPAITYQKISGAVVQAFQKDTNLAHPIFQVSCWGKTYQEVKGVAKQIKLALRDFSGLMGGAVPVSAVLIQGEVDDYETDSKTFSIKIDFEIWHEEAET